MDSRPCDPIVEELTALRRVAVLVARGAPPEETFAAVTAEVRQLLDADLTSMARYDPDGEMTTVALWSPAGDFGGTDLRTPLGGQNVATLVFETGRPARLDDYYRASGPVADVVRKAGIRSSVGVPIGVEGRLWGVMVVSSKGTGSWPADTEARLGGFTELVGTAIANAQARTEIRDYAEEQAALRRVATLVAGGAPPATVFAAVAAEAGWLLDADLTAVGRYDPGDVVTMVGAWRSSATVMSGHLGTRTSLGGKNMASLVFQTRQPVRIDDYDDATGAAADVGRDWGFRGAVGAPITVEGRLWGVMSVGNTGDKPLPTVTEARLAGFTGLVGTAIANAEAQAALAASRARLVAAADEERRRIERDLHDGAQQRLLALALRVRELQAANLGASELKRRLDDVATALDATLEQLREIAHGIHPAVLAEGGLGRALRTLARRCPVPVNVRVQVTDRPPHQVEIATYYVVSEALTNTAKHAGASAVEVDVDSEDDALRVSIRDDGRGGADISHGSGLVGLKDRVEALGGQIMLHSPPGQGTSLVAHIPLAGSPPDSGNSN